MKKIKNKAKYIKKLSNINNILTELLIQSEEEMEHFRIADSILKIKKQINQVLCALKESNGKTNE
jgi:hypothetical protein